MFLVGVFLYPEYKKNNKAVLKFFGIIVVWGYFIELVFSRIRFLYGDLEYYSVLSPKLFGVPFLIGLYLSVLLFGLISFIETYYCKKSTSFKVMACAFFTLIFGLILEPVAVKFDYWSWSGGVPWIRYLVWFIVGYVVSNIFYKRKYEIDINLGRKIFIAILGFVLLSRIFSV